MPNQKVAQVFPDEETIRVLMALLSFEKEDRRSVTVADITRRILENHLNRLVDVGIVRKMVGITPEYDRYNLPEDLSLEEATRVAKAKVNVDYPLREEVLRRYAAGVPIRISIKDLSEDGRMDNS